MTDNGILQSTKTAVELGKLDERLKNMEDRLHTAHKRIDGLEAIVREDLKEIRKSLEPLKEWMNRGKGGMAILVAGGGLGGGAIASLIAWWMG